MRRSNPGARPRSEQSAGARLDVGGPLCGAMLGVCRRSSWGDPLGFTDGFGMTDTARHAEALRNHEQSHIALHEFGLP